MGANEKLVDRVSSLSKETSLTVAETTELLSALEEFEDWEPEAKKEPSPPFEKLYAVVIRREEKLNSYLNPETRIYGKLSSAKARITSAIIEERFAAPVELWEVGENGWKLLLEASGGEHFEKKVFWNSTAATAIERKRKEKEKAAAREEAQARAEFERLKERFEN